MLKCRLTKYNISIFELSTELKEIKKKILRTCFYFTQDEWITTTLVKEPIYSYAVEM